MARRPIESIADAQRRAKRRIPGPIYKALISGNEKGVTIRDNVDAFSDIGWRPLVARETYEEQPLDRDLSSTALGMDLSVPFMIGPAGAQAVDPRAEVAVAAAAKTVGTAIGLSSFATKPIEEVVAANPNALYQLYWTGSKDDILWRMERAKAAGAKGLIITLDATGGGLGRRDWDSPPVPAKIDLEALIRFAPMALSRPGWLARFLFGGGIPDLAVPNSANGPGENPPFSTIYAELMQTQVPTWDDVKWLREEWGGKFVVKGIFRSDEARRAIDIGADAIVVSNHGGNNLDSTYASIRVLPAIAKAIGDQAEVWFDGGIRRGMDVAKALALGADTVLLGRAWLWGLAAGGEKGVLDVLRMLEDGLHFALVGLGHRSINELSPDDIVAPEGFFIQS
ncbi:alpha-hydroxy-acid oxidizing enzyme [Oceanobacillus arenosus]|uniref:L-lactate oxidase n=1 Tax=Oceanobacillus arenosus TaxID=1229153 RepID=A0A3D8PNG8_9BACI|nr:pre-mycofactocin synthase MftD [Oceanobacillus arenosus]RDW17643.1 alpha-hydroxy-acid oxidizing enzyme [Oceanobacillus arenosus]